jgi:hypothetical protein
VCLPLQQWTETLVRFDYVGMSAFHSCAVVDLKQSLSEWHIYFFLSVFWCAVARISQLLVKLGKSGSKIREMLVQIYGDNAMTKTADYNV